MASVVVFRWILLLCIITNAADIPSYPPGVFWEHSLDTRTNMDSSGSVSIFCGTIVLNPCPNAGLLACCTNIADGGTTWIAQARSTSGYHHITLEFDMNPESVEANEYCKIYYSIHDTTNWIELAKYNSDTQFHGLIELPSNTSDNSLGIRIMFQMQGSGADACYLSSGRLYGIAITQNPTTDPTHYPTITRNPTSVPTIDPTSKPTETTNNPTNDPTNEPTAEPTYIPTNNPTETTKDPTNDPTNDPTSYPTVNPVASKESEASQTTTTLIADIKPIINNDGNDKLFLGLEILIVLISILIILIVFISCCCFMAFMKKRKQQKRRVTTDTQNMEMISSHSPRANTDDIVSYYSSEPGAESIKTELNTEQVTNMVVADNVPLPEDERSKKEEFYARCIADYIDSSDGDQLDLKEGRIYFIMKTMGESGWWYGIDENGLDGWIPSNYLRRCNEEEQEQWRQEQQINDDKLLTESMSQSYRRISKHGLMNNMEGIDKYFNIMPPKIPPVLLSVTCGSDDISDDSSNNTDIEQKTIGGMTKSDIV